MSNKLRINYSPNFSSNTRITKNIRFLIFHYTGMTSEKKAINRLTNEKSKVSSHYFIKRNGELILMVPDLHIAWHAGKSVWKKYKSLNKYSIGIELSNKGHGKGYQKFSKKQILSLIRISKLIIKKYKIKKFNILGHSDVAYNRKKDPGEKFPWQFLAKKKIGIWHNLNNNNLLKLRGIKITDDEVPNEGYTLSNKKLLRTGFKFLYNLDDSIKEMINKWKFNEDKMELEYVYKDFLLSGCYMDSFIENFH